MPVLGAALRESLREGYRGQDLRSDLMAGVVVGIVALPLSMALAIASGVAPQHGLYTAVVAGFIAAALGGSRCQVTGPTAAFVVILAPVAARFGLGGLLIAGALAGILLIVMGLARFGRLIEFVPYPVTTGFTAGIAVVIATLQLKDLLGLQTGPLPEHYLARLLNLARALPTWHGADLAVGLFTLTILVGWRHVDRRVPAPLAALLLGSLAAYGLSLAWPGFEPATINQRFSYLSDGVMLPGIPRTLPPPSLPWHLPGPHGQPLALSFQLVYALLPSAFAIAMLGAIESLLSAVVADGMTGARHDPDAELVAIGMANVVAPFFGGIAATGAIARTATSIRSGARSPLAAVFHALFVLVALIALAPALGYLPMASLAALLLLVAWNMSEARHFVQLLRTAARSDVLVLLTCFLLTVLLDMTISITVGVMLAALLFIQRMAAVSGVTLVGAGHHPAMTVPMPRGVVVYDLAGPLFFGAAQKAMHVLRRTERRKTHVVVLDVEDVPVMDATGLMALESLVKDLNDAGIKVVLAGIQAQPLRTLTRAGWRNRRGRLRIFRSVTLGLELARRTVEADPAFNAGSSERRPET
jgi:sulfate permease, SulP family